MMHVDLASVADRILHFALVFVASVVIVSAWLGAFFRLHPLETGLFSIVAAVLFVRFFPWHVQLPRSMAAIALGLFAFLAVSPLLHQGVAPSADVVNSTAVRLFSFWDRIPSSFEPFSPAGYSYQPGFPLLVEWASAASNFSVEDYSLAWIIGGLFAAFQVCGVYLFVRDTTGSDSAARVSALLFLSTKLVYENFFWGEWGWQCATALLLAGFVLLQRSNPSAFVLLAAVVLLHPAVAMFVPLVAIALVFTQRLDWKRFFSLGLSAVLAIPAFAIVLFPTLANVASLDGSGVGIPLVQAIESLRFIPAWFGFALSAFLLVLFGAAWWSKKRVPWETTRPLWVLLAVGLAAYIVLGLTGTVLANRVAEIMVLAGVGLGGHYFLAVAPPRFTVFPGTALLVVLAVIAFFSSGSLLEKFDGTKISLDEITLAKRFAEMDPAFAPTVFLSLHGGKIAEVSRKIPFDSNSGIFVPNLPIQLGENEGTRRMRERHARQAFILRTECASCVLDLNAEYAWVDERWTSIVLDMPVVLQDGNIRIYRLNEKDA